MSKIYWSFRLLACLFAAEEEEEEEENRIRNHEELTFERLTFPGW